jgi:hypothetical protein
MEMEHFFYYRRRKNSFGTAIEICNGADNSLFILGEIVEEIVRD